MPCNDGREAQDKLDLDRRHKALTAILCGVMSQPMGPHSAWELGRTWCHYHRMIDDLVIRGRLENWDEIARLGGQADAVLDRAYAVLCQ